jgi:hypothetical protein
MYIREKVVAHYFPEQVCTGINFFMRIPQRALNAFTIAFGADRFDGYEIVTKSVKVIFLEIKSFKQLFPIAFGKLVVNTPDIYYSQVCPSVVIFSLRVLHNTSAVLIRSRP